MRQTLVLRFDQNISTQFLFFALLVLAHLNAPFKSPPLPLSCHKFLYLSLPARQFLLGKSRLPRQPVRLQVGKHPRTSLPPPTTDMVASRLGVLSLIAIVFGLVGEALGMWVVVSMTSRRPGVELLHSLSERRPSMQALLVRIFLREALDWMSRLEYDLSSHWDFGGVSIPLSAERSLPRS